MPYFWIVFQIYCHIFGFYHLLAFFLFIIIVLTNPIGTNLMMIAAINKEDYLGYRTRVSGEEAAAEYVSPDPEPEDEPEKADSEPEEKLVEETEKAEPENPAEEKQETVYDTKKYK